MGIESWRDLNTTINFGTKTHHVPEITLNQGFTLGF